MRSRTRGPTSNASWHDSGDEHHEAAGVGEELFGVVDLIDAQVGLRRALSDPSVEGKRKADLVKAVLGSHVSEVTLRIVTEVVRARWSRMRDLADAIETLAVLAMLIEADAHPGSGHRTGESDDVEDELFRFGRIVEGNAALRAALSDSALPDENKVSLVSALVEEKARPVTLRLLTQIATRPRGRSPEDAIADYTSIASRRRARLVAGLRPPSDSRTLRSPACKQRSLGSTDMSPSADRSRRRHRRWCRRAGR